MFHFSFSDKQCSGTPLAALEAVLRFGRKGLLGWSALPKHIDTLAARSFKMKILILDPDWRFAQQARDYLESHAHLVVHLTGTDLAEGKLSHWKPDLVLFSAELADSGLLERMHGQTDGPAILLTGWMDRYDRVWQAWQTGGHELLMKPVFDMDELYQSMVVALENAAAGSRSRLCTASA